MKRLIYVLFPVLLGCGNSSKENSQYDKVMIFSSDTSYVNDISGQMDDLLSGFYHDSSTFSIGRAKTMKASRVADAYSGDVDPFPAILTPLILVIWGIFTNSLTILPFFS